MWVFNCVVVSRSTYYSNEGIHVVNFFFSFLLNITFFLFQEKRKLFHHLQLSADVRGKEMLLVTIPFFARSISLTDIHTFVGVRQQGQIEPIRRHDDDDDDTFNLCAIGCFREVREYFIIYFGGGRSKPNKEGKRERFEGTKLLLFMNLNSSVKSIVKIYLFYPPLSQTGRDRRKLGMQNTCECGY